MGEPQPYFYTIKKYYPHALCGYARLSAGNLPSEEEEEVSGAGMAPRRRRRRRVCWFARQILLQRSVAGIAKWKSPPIYVERVGNALANLDPCWQLASRSSRSCGTMR